MRNCLSPPLTRKVTLEWTLKFAVVSWNDWTAGQSSMISKQHSQLCGIGNGGAQCRLPCNFPLISGGRIYFVNVGIRLLMCSGKLCCVLDFGCSFGLTCGKLQLWVQVNYSVHGVILDACVLYTRIFGKVNSEKKWLLAVECLISLHLLSFAYSNPCEWQGTLTDFCCISGQSMSVVWHIDWLLLCFRAVHVSGMAHWLLLCFRAIHVSGMEDLLLYIASSEDERQLCMHILEIVSLMFREQVGCYQPCVCFCFFLLFKVFSFLAF